MIEVPDAGHAIMLDQPVALATGLRTVLAGWDLSAAG
jgi:pimeloyl-ACP methyl ester carboxylesterase